MGLLLLWGATATPTPPDVLPDAFDGLNPIDHALEAEDRLLEQFRTYAPEGSPYVKALAIAPVSESQPLENTLFDMLSKRLLDTAIGEQLNVLGRLLDYPRGPLSDDQYRTGLKARVLVYRSNGPVEDIYRPFALLVPTATFSIVQYYPASLVLRWLSPFLTTDVATQYALILKKARSAGIGAAFYWWPRAQSQMFKFSHVIDTSETSSSHGFGDVLQTRGGHLAGIMVA